MERSPAKVIQLAPVNLAGGSQEPDDFSVSPYGGPVGCSGTIVISSVDIHIQVNTGLHFLQVVLTGKLDQFLE